MVESTVNIYSIVYDVECIFWVFLAVMFALGDHAKFTEKSMSVTQILLINTQF